MGKETGTLSCKDVENFLQPYLEYRLDNGGTEVLIKHLKKCRECRDELEIRYLLHEGLKRLEDGQDFNLKTELEERLYQSEQHLLMIERLKTSVALLSIAVSIFAVVQIILILIG